MEEFPEEIQTSGGGFSGDEVPEGNIHLVVVFLKDLLEFFGVGSVLDFPKNLGDTFVALLAVFVEFSCHTIWVFPAGSASVPVGVLQGHDVCVVANPWLGFSRDGDDLIEGSKPCGGLEDAAAFAVGAHEDVSGLEVFDFYEAPVPEDD